MIGKPVPLVVVEEHHEAFMIWKRAGLHGVTLLHVDEHADMSVPRLRAPLAEHDPEHDPHLADLVRFTYDELDIGSFIWASVYHGMISEIAWLRTWHPGARNRREMFICAANREGTEFMTGARFAQHWNAKDARFTAYETLNPADSFEPAGPVILDIDLDYFSSLPYPEYDNSRVEITARAYEEFLNNPYHILRISPGGKVGIRQENGSYFLVFNDFPPQKPRVSTDAIDQRLAQFFAFLDRNRIRPALIDICRSRHSGYTPKEHLERIESGVLAGLGERHALDIRAVTEFQSVKEVVRV